MKNMKNISQTIRNIVDKQPPGEVFTLEDILPKKSTTKNYFSAAKELSELQRLQHISRVRKGLYFKPYKSKFSNKIITDVSSSFLINYYQKKFNNKLYVTNAPLFNGMGLTEQVAAVSIFAVEKPPKNFDGERLYFVKSKCAITDENKKYLQILDCIERIDMVSAKHPGQVADSLANLHISHLSDAESVELMRYSKFYSPRTRAILAALLATLDKNDLAQQLKNTYNANFRFELYFCNSKVLSNKEDYGIYHTN